MFMWLSRRCIRVSLDYQIGFGRAWSLSMPRPPALPPPCLARLELLRAPLRASAATSDAALAVQFFRARPAGAGFLAADEAQAAVADYDDNRPGWRRALLEEAACVCTPIGRAHV